MRVSAWGALLLAVLLAGPVRAGCVPEKRAELPVRMQDGFAFVPATVGGTPVTFLLDTGAQGMLLLPEAAEALRLPVDARGGTRLLGTGGSRVAPNVVLRGMALGGMAVAADSVPVAELPGVPRTNPPLAGLLGAPLLAGFDWELDVRQGRMALFDGFGCASPRPSPSANVLPLQLSPEGEAFVPVRVNNQPLLALIDTGSRSTILTERAAQQLGLGGPVSANVARGVDGTAVPIRHVRVRTMQVGTEVLRNAPVSISSLQLDHGDMLLGLDYLGTRPISVFRRDGVLVVGAQASTEADALARN